MTFDLKKDDIHSIIGKSTSFNIIEGYSGFTQLDPTKIYRNPIIYDQS